MFKERANNRRIYLWKYLMRIILFGVITLECLLADERVVVVVVLVLVALLSKESSLLPSVAKSGFQSIEPHGAFFQRFKLIDR